MDFFSIFKKPKTEYQPPAVINPPQPLKEGCIARILVADDDKNLREYYRELLIQNKYEAIAAGNGQEALDIVFQNRPDLVLLDVMMPKMGGLEFLTKIRQEVATKELPVIVLTNAGEVENMETAQLYSAYKFLIKSRVTKGELLSTIANALEEQKTKITTASPTALT